MKPKVFGGLEPGYLCAKHVEVGQCVAAGTAFLKQDDGALLGINLDALLQIPLLESIKCILCFAGSGHWVDGHSDYSGVVRI